MTYYERNKQKRLAYQKEYQKRRWLVDPQKMRAIKVKSVYGISQEDLNVLKEKHGGKCGICKAEAKLNIDHDHKTGKVRGLLCGHCNRAIGQFQDDIDRVENAVKYLRKHSGK